MSVAESDEQEETTNKMTTPSRPKQPIPVLPCRLITPNNEVITWFNDKYVTKKNKITGDSETWVPVEMCSAAKLTLDMLTPAGHLHKTHYTTETSTEELEGEIVNYHMVEVGDSEVLCWEDDCHCFEDQLQAMYDSYDNESSRCETLGFHVESGDCPVCGPALTDEEN